MLRPSMALFSIASVALAGVVGVTGLVACSSDSGGTSSSGSSVVDGSTEGGKGDGGGSGGGDGGGGGDAGGDVAVNECKTFVDRSAAGASRTIAWGFPVSTAPERCMTVKKGQEVTFDGDFGAHPLAGSGGDTPNPISGAAAGKVTFTATGTFGFVCTIHPGMTGAIKVIE